MGSRIVGGTTNIIVRGNQQQQAQIRDIIKKKTIRAYELRQSSTKLASDLGHATQDWARDWLRISKYLMHSAFNAGRAQNILKNHGKDAEVYFDVYPKACKRCKELYLTDPEDENSQPKIFKLKDIIANGNNIGRKADDWLPTLDPIHPYCRCTVNRYNPKYEWNPKTHAFSTLKKVKLNKQVQDKLGNSKLRDLIKVTKP